MSTIKIKIPFEMDEYFPMYHLHFILSDERYESEIRGIERQLQQDQLAFILKNSQKRHNEQIPVKIILNDAQDSRYNDFSDDEKKEIFSIKKFS